MTDQPATDAQAQPPATEAERPKAPSNLPALQAPRLPFHPLVEERFGVGRTEWKALVEAVFPLAETIDSVVMALAYCKARKLDIFKKPVHIVPIYNAKLRRMVETVWPGISEIRTTAMRTGQYAGKDRTQFGPLIEMELGGVKMRFPEWAQITIRRVVPGAGVCVFEGPEVHWLEYYATAKHDTEAPNAMWRRKARSQLEKCAEAGALRMAFPEELGNEYAAEEMEGQTIGGEDAPARAGPGRATGLKDRLEAAAGARTGGFDAGHVARETGGEQVIDGEFEEVDRHDSVTGEVFEAEDGAQAGESGGFPGDKAAPKDGAGLEAAGLKTGAQLAEEKAAEAKKPVAERVAEFWAKAEAEGVTTADLAKFYRAATPLRTDMDQVDPEGLAEFDERFNVLFVKVEDAEKAKTSSEGSKA